MRLINARTRQAVASHVELAETRRARRRGLLGRDRLDTGAALMLTPCAGIHTAFMRFAIDVVFVDRDGRAVRMVARVQPWRISIELRARTVIELPAGRLDACPVNVGDYLYLAAAEG